MNKEQTRIAAQVMQAFAEGKQIQGRRAGQGNDWMTMVSPVWDWYNSQYRIKPETKKYRVALRRVHNGPLAFIINSESLAQQVEQWEDFIKWLTDWTEY
jgi:hypothetical protein